MFDSKPRITSPIVWMAIAASLTVHIATFAVVGGLSVTVPLSYALDQGQANPTVDVTIESVEFEDETG
jgi:cell division protein FtsX